jgi:hypothetical protein
MNYEQVENITDELKPERPLNYFSYNSEIEDAFIRRRGKHIWLSSIDWALIETWKEMGIPLHVALRGIERAFDSWEAKPRKRTVKTLLYCQEEVEAQYAEWIESRVGAGPQENREDEAASTSENEHLPFHRSAILEHLRRGRLALVELGNERKRTQEDDFCDALFRAAGLLEELKFEFEESSSPNAQKLEDSLTGLERMLSDSLLAVVPAQQRDALTSEVEGQLRPYRSHMERPVYQQTKDNLLLKRLREQFAVPRLSLFYL